jgi:hypothetical protein
MREVLVAQFARDSRGQLQAHSTYLRKHAKPEEFAGCNTCATDKQM